MADSKTTRTRLDGTDADVGKSGMPIQFESLDPWAPMTRPEAVTITNRIKRTADELWSLLSTAHARRAWEPLGYGSWHEFVGTEFSMSRGRSYQLLNQAMVIRQIEVAIAEQRGDSVSTSVDISEAAARDIKPVLGEVVTDIRDRMRSLPEMDPREHVHAAVDVARNKRRSRRPGLVITPRGRRFNVERSMIGLTSTLDGLTYAATERLRPEHLSSMPDAARTWARQIRESMSRLDKVLAILDAAAENVE